MPEDSENNSYTNRLAALRLIRENMFLDKAKQYGWLDIAEDLPSSARAIAPIFKNVLPSAGLISSDPEERKQQIQKAIDKIKSTTNSDKPILPEVLSSAGKSALGAALPATLITALVNSMGFRGIKKKLRGGKSKFQLPVDPVGTLKHHFSSKGNAKDFLKEILSESSMGVGLAGIHGGLVPLSSHGYHISDKSLEDARQILEKQPQITSLPSAEFLSAMKDSGDEGSPALKKLKNVAKATGLGLLTGMEGGVLPSALSALGKFTGNTLSSAAAKAYSKVNKPGALNSLAKYMALDKAKPTGLTSGVREAFTKNLKRDIINAGQWGAGAGALAGAFTDTLPADNEEKRISNKA